MKNRIIPAIMASILLCLITVRDLSARKAQAPYSGNPRTIVHDFLDIEKNFGAGENNYSRINSLINSAMSLIARQEEYSSAQALELLGLIDSLLKKEGFTFSENFLISTGLATGRIDCDSYSAIYVAIAEAMGLPIIPANAPGHTFIRFIFRDGTYMNWEPTEGKSHPDSWYVEKKKISEISIKKGVYLAGLERKEFLAVEYNNIGAWLLSKKKYSDSLPYFDMALHLYPAYSSAWHNSGTARYGLGKPDEALKDLLKARSLDPARATTLNTIGDIYFDRKEYSRALDCYENSIKADPDFYPPYYSIGQLLKLSGDNRQAAVWIRKAEELKLRKK